MQKIESKFFGEIRLLEVIEINTTDIIWTLHKPKKVPTNSGYGYSFYRTYHYAPLLQLLLNGVEWDWESKGELGAPLCGIGRRDDVDSGHLLVVQITVITERVVVGPEDARVIVTRVRLGKVAVQ